MNTILVIRDIIRTVTFLVKLTLRVVRRITLPLRNGRRKPAAELPASRLDESVSSWQESLAVHGRRS